MSLDRVTKLGALLMVNSSAENLQHFITLDFIHTICCTIGLVLDCDTANLLLFQTTVYATVQLYVRYGKPDHQQGGSVAEWLACWT